MVLTLIGMLIKVNLLPLANCGNPQDQVNDRVRVLDFMEPALEEGNVTFGCLSGPILSGPHTSMCLRNGIWEPDPREVTCTGTYM